MKCSELIKEEIYWHCWVSDVYVTGMDHETVSSSSTAGVPRTDKFAQSDVVKIVWIKSNFTTYWIGKIKY